MRSTLQFGLLAAAILAVACTDGPTVGSFDPGDATFLAKGGGGGGGGGGSTNVSVTVNDQDPGLTAVGDPFAVSIPSDGGVQIKPGCSTTGRLTLVNMGAAVDGLGSRSTCNGKTGQGFVFLKTWSGTTGSVNCSATSAPSGSNFSATSRFFFQVDSDNDGRFDDAQYTIVLTNCTASGNSPARLVTATQGDLYNQAGALLQSGVAINVSITY